MLLQVYPQEGLLLEGLARRRIGQQLVAECLKRTPFFCSTIVRKIDDTETAFAQSAVNFVLAADDIALLIQFGGFLTRSIPPRRRDGLPLLSRVLVLSE